MIYGFLAVLTGLGIAYAIPLLIERHPGPLLVFADLGFRTPYCTFWQAVADASLSAAERRGREEIRAASRLVKKDEDLELWQTPRRHRFRLRSTHGRVHQESSFRRCETGCRRRTDSGACAKNGYSHRFSQSIFIRNKALRRTKIGWQSPFFTRTHFYHGLLGRVVVSAKGIWDSGDPLALFGNSSAGAGNSFVVHGSGAEAIGQISVTTIDNLVSELELPRVDFTKADAKGATERMILGATETLARYRPRMALSTEEPPEDPQRLVQVVRGHRPDYQFTCGPCLTHGVERVYTIPLASCGRT